ncbi:hypothetical protein AA481_004965 [Salmonella enterica subsp. enterica]|nr:hypothetical protein [Salmonella enterica subsp. enterica serovar Thompson]EED9464864.1 hypothetical protein [Salmonella enterica subsp. enterica serovar Abaetetuba]EED9492064.1 hypothetical protein [Salmonella enterica subsp. enterica serovar Thompson]
MRLFLNVLMICAINLPKKESAMRKARFTEHQIIIVIESVLSGLTVKDVC